MIKYEDEYSGFINDGGICYGEGCGGRAKLTPPTWWRISDKTLSWTESDKFSGDNMDGVRCTESGYGYTSPLLEDKSDFSAYGIVSMITKNITEL